MKEKIIALVVVLIAVAVIIGGIILIRDVNKNPLGGYNSVSTVLYPLGETATTVTSTGSNAYAQIGADVDKVTVMATVSNASTTAMLSVIPYYSSGPLCSSSDTWYPASVASSTGATTDWLVPYTARFTPTATGTQYFSFDINNLNTQCLKLNFFNDQTASSTGVILKLITKSGV